MKLKTWMIEAGVVTILLLISLFFKEFILSEVICSIAVLVTFMHGQVSDRMYEKQKEKEIPDVECYMYSRYYYITKEILWVAFFLTIQSYAALIGAVALLSYPLWRKIYRGNKSWLHYLNFYFLQFLFIRLAKVEEKRVEHFDLKSIDIMPTGDLSPCGTGEMVKYRKYAIMGFVLPFSGWGTDYKILGKKFIWHITKFKPVKDE